MQFEKINKIDSVFSEIFEEDNRLSKFKNTWGPLASFITDYEHLKGLTGLTQKQIAENAKTTQSAISRLVRLKGKPTYDLLRRVSEAAGGKLKISPMGEYCITLDYDLKEKAKNIAINEDISVNELLSNILRSEINAINNTLEIPDTEKDFVVFSISKNNFTASCSQNYGTSLQEEDDFLNSNLYRGNAS